MRIIRKQLVLVKDLRSQLAEQKNKVSAGVLRLDRVK